MRQRNVYKKITSTEDKAKQPEQEEQKILKEKPTQSIGQKSSLAQRCVLWTVVALAAAVRLFAIASPREVVFDEVHFGGFANRYLRREYYFDVHPPLGKMVLAGLAWLGGYRDGGFAFGKIGQDIPSQVPIVLMRSVQALLGALTVGMCVAMVQGLSRSSLGKTWFAGAAGLILALDTSLVLQSRLLLLDAQLIFWVVASVFAWSRFRGQRQVPFGMRWFAWLALTGISLGCALGVKMVGLLTVGTIGLATVVDLWEISGFQKGLSRGRLWGHLLARTVFLIGVPLSIYLASFALHFRILTRSGPGDAFMTPEFQSNLEGNALNGGNAIRRLRSGQVIRLQNAAESIFLHSHPHRIPQTHHDGKVSSNGQQVNGYSHADENNTWRILGEGDPLDGDTVEGQLITDGMRIRLLHLATGKLLKTHDVASPLTRTNMEITAVDPQELMIKGEGIGGGDGDGDGDAREESQKRRLTLLEETLWEVRAMAKRTKLGQSASTSNNHQQIMYSLASHFSLVNVKHGVHLRNHQESLPSWGYNQRELNGDRRGEGEQSRWLVHSIISPKPSKSLKF